jgi:hypothetical protein
MSIRDETQKNISETTLKRLFGFAKVKNRFSQYTINALLEYVENDDQRPNPKKSWVVNDKVNQQHADLQLFSRSITFQSLSIVKNRFKLPAEYTIPRSFINFDFDYFYDSRHTFFPLIAQGGFGKTVCLFHLVQKLLDEEEAKYRDDLVLYVRANELFLPLDKPTNIENKVKTLLQLSEGVNLSNYLSEINAKKKSKLILIVDGISDVATTENKNAIFENLLILVSNLGTPETVKIVLSLRTANWNRFFTIFKDLPAVRTKWYPGAYFNTKDNTNVPQFSDQEIECILQKIHGRDCSNFEDVLKKKLKYPPFLPWYYSIKDVYNLPAICPEIIAFDIVSNFIKARVYNTTYATEKDVICKKTILYSNYGKSGKIIPKTNLLAEITAFKNAYQQLIIDGVFTEEKHEEAEQIIEYITFIHPNIFEYFLFSELLDKNGNHINAQFLERLHKLGLNSKTYFQVLLWAARRLVTTLDFSSVQHLFNVPLPSHQKCYLLKFVVQLIDVKTQSNALTLNGENESKLHAIVSKYFVHFDFASHYYDVTLTSLTNITKEPNYYFFYQVSLATLDCLRLDLVALKRRLPILENIEIEGENWLINPYVLLRKIYGIMIGKAINEKDKMLQIESILVTENDRSKENDILLKTLLGTTILLIYNALAAKYSENAKLAAQFFEKRPELMNTGYAQYISALTSYTSGEQAPLNVDTSENGNQLDTLFGSRKTIFIEAVNSLASAQACKNNRQYKAAIKHASICLKICEKSKIDLGLLIIYQLFADIYTELGQIELRNEWLNKKLFIINDKNLDKSNFQRVGD